MNKPPGVGGGSQSGGSAQPGVSKREAKPEKYLFQSLKLPQHPPRVQQLLRECKRIEIEQFPGVACVMSRVLVELSVSSNPVLALTGAKEADSLRNKIMAALRHLDPNIEHPRNNDKQLAQAYFEASNLGITYLNAFVHNSAVQPDPHLARRFSSVFRPLLERLDGII